MGLCCFQTLALLTVFVEFAAFADLIFSRSLDVSDTYSQVTTLAFLSVKCQTYTNLVKKMQRNIFSKKYENLHRQKRALVLKLFLIQEHKTNSI